MPLKCYYAHRLLNSSKGVKGLSKEVAYYLVNQRAAKLQSLKVCSVRDSSPGRPESNDSIVIRKNVASNPKGLEYFFDRKL